MLLSRLVSIAILTALVGIEGAQACSVPNSTTDSIRSVVVEHGGWQVSDAQCELLKKHGLSINVIGDASVMHGNNVAWAMVQMMDSKRNIVSDKSGTSTRINWGEASQDVANNVLYEAIGQAIESLEWETAVSEVESYRNTKPAGKTKR